ncbi:hypothetical protein SNEBB_008126 [Seison nebaliae]|nr:hypothetical protein SNEBB_008126 [Seison nebaliae]
MEEYKQVLALYPYGKENEDELTLVKGDILEVTGTPETGWYEGRKINITFSKKSTNYYLSDFGVFPSNYVTPLEKQNNESQPNDENDHNRNKQKFRTNSESEDHLYNWCKVKCSFTASNPHELSVQTGDEVALISKDKENGWWKVRHNKQVGYIPHHCVDSHIDNVESNEKSSIKSMDGDKTSRKNRRSGSKSARTRSGTEEINDIFKTDKHGMKKPVKLAALEEIHPINGAKQNRIRNSKDNFADDDNEKRLDKIETLKRSPTTDDPKRTKSNLPKPKRSSAMFHSEGFNAKSIDLETESNAGESVDYRSSNKPRTSSKLQEMYNEISTLYDRMGEMEVRFLEKIDALTTEVDEEKKERASLNIEVNRLRRLVQELTMKPSIGQHSSRRFTTSSPHVHSPSSARRSIGNTGNHSPNSYN